MFSYKTQYIIQQPGIQSLESIMLLKHKMEQQQNNNGILCHDVKHYVIHSEDCSTTHEQAECTEIDIEKDLESGKEMSEQTKTVDEMQTTGAVYVCDIIARSGAALSLYMHYTEDCQAHVLLDALHQFVHEGETSLQENNSIFDVMSPYVRVSLYSQHCARVYHEATTMLVDLQIQHDGSLKYMQAYSSNTEQRQDMLLYRQNNIMHTWSGKIQQIDYKHLYDSLDALFTIAYARSNIRATIMFSSIDMCKQMWRNIFNGVHFTNFEYYTLLDPLTQRIEHMNMPIAHVVFDAGYYRIDDILDREQITITELAHMTILMNMHKHMVNTKDTFAYNLANALLNDIKRLWELREHLMPKVRKYDIWQYGVVPVIQDTIPYDHHKHTDTIKVPEYMLMHSSNIKDAQSTEEYVSNIHMYGTREMCVWGCAAACLRAAVQSSLRKGKIRNELIHNIETVGNQVDKRFKHFSNDFKLQIYERLLSYDMAQISEPMPLFCLVLCNVLSLSNSLTFISCTYEGREQLNTKNLIRLYQRKA